MKKRILSVLLVAVMVMAILPLATATEETKSPVGMSVAGFDTTDLYGNPVDSSIIGEYELTFMNYWATWCGPCTSEMPYIQQLYEEYQPLGLNVLGLLCEGNGCTPQSAAAYCEANGITYTTVRPDSVLNRVINNSGGYIPVSYVVNKEGEILAYHVGSMTYAQILEFVMPYFPRPEPEAITIAPDSAEISENRMTQFTLEYEPVNAERIPAEWSSSDESIATVTEGGLVTGISEGEVTITATLANGLTDTATVTVTASTGELEAPYYVPATEITDGKTYLIVANYQGGYYMMSNTEVINGRLRLDGIQVAAEDMYLREDGTIVILNAEADVQWTLTPNEDDPTGYDVMNIGNEMFLSTVKNSGIYRLGLKSKSKVYWHVIDGMLAASEDGYTDDRRFVSYYADEDVDDEPNFDLLNSDHADFITPIFYELVSDGSNYELGDVNMDGLVNTGDASMVLRYAVGLDTMSDEQLALADFNGDELVNTGDASGILRVAVGLE